MTPDYKKPYTISTPKGKVVIPPLKKVLDGIKDFLTVDLETSGLDWKTNKIAGISLSNGVDRGYYLWSQVKKEKQLLGALENAKVDKRTHNGSFDFHFLEQETIKPAGQVFDTMVMFQMATAHEVWQSCALKTLAAKHIDKGAKDEQDDVKAWLQEHKQVDYSLVPFDIMAPYAIKDAVYTDGLYPIAKKLLEDGGMWKTYMDLESKLFWVLLRMESRGVPINVPYFEKLSKEFLKEEEQLEVAFFKMAGTRFNLSSNDEMAKFLYDDLGLKPKWMTDSNSVSEKVLSYIDHPLIPMILKYRAIHKLRTTYAESFVEKQVGGRLYANFNQFGARTSRTSSSDPNLQNIPGKTEHIHRGFVAPKGKIIRSRDYKQIELRILAHYGKVRALLDAFEKGGDPHTETAMGVFGKPADQITKSERKVGKTINFAIIYGQGAKSLNVDMRRKAGIEQSVEQTKDFLDRTMRHYPEIWDLRRRVKSAVEERGGVRTMMGQFIGVTVEKHYKGVNYLIQGSAGGIMKKALIRLEDLFKGSDYEMIMTVHDNIMDVSSAGKTDKKMEKKILDCLCDFPELRVPIGVDIESFTTNWADIKKESSYEPQLKS